MVKEIHTDKAPAAIGPYSQAIQAGDFTYVSGQNPVNPETGNVAEGIEKQTHQVLKNIQAILTKAKADFLQVVKSTIYLASIDDIAIVDDIYSNYLQKPFPARVTVEVSRLPKDVLIEMDVIVHQP